MDRGRARWLILRECSSSCRIRRVYPPSSNLIKMPMIWEIPAAQKQTTWPRSVHLTSVWKSKSRSKITQDIFNRADQNCQNIKINVDKATVKQPASRPSPLSQIISKIAPIRPSGAQWPTAIPDPGKDRQWMTLFLRMPGRNWIIWSWNGSKNSRGGRPTSLRCWRSSMVRVVLGSHRHSILWTKSSIIWLDRWRLKVMQRLI